MELAIKIASMIALFIITFVVGLLPLRLRTKRQLTDENRGALEDLRYVKLLRMCSCFAGGAFFATTLLNLIPLVEEKFQAVFDHAGISTDFPVAEFAISVGFFLILTLEQIVLVFTKKPSPGQGGNTMKSPLLGKTHTASYGSGKNKIYELVHTSINIEEERGGSDNNENQPSSVSPNNNLDRSLGVSSQNTDEVTINNDHGLEHSIFATINEKQHLRSYLLLVALLIHALFEGLAIGLIEDISSMMEVLGPVIIHKCVLAFSMGINLVQHGFPLFKVVQSSFLFSAVSPAGFGFGILLTKAPSNVARVLSAVFQAIATGTFLYVTFFEIFFHELNRKECRNLLKVLMIILGYSLFASGVYLETH